MMKHSFEVTGVTDGGEKFVGKCVAYDIIGAIQIFRNNGYSPHTVQNMIQVHADRKIGVEYVGKLMYPEVDKMSLTETLVAQQMYEMFNKNDLENFSIVRKQILKNMPVDYFRKKTEEI